MAFAIIHAFIGFIKSIIEDLYLNGTDTYTCRWPIEKMPVNVKNAYGKPRSAETVSHGIELNGVLDMKKILILFGLFFSVVISLDIQRKTVPNIFEIELMLIAALYIAHVVFRLCYVLPFVKKCERICGKKLTIVNRFSAFFLFSRAVIFVSADKSERIVFLWVHKKYARYHIDQRDRLEVYIGNREAYRTHRIRVSIARRVDWKLNSKIKFPQYKELPTVFVFSRIPMDVSSSDIRANRYLASADTFFENCTVFSKSAFLKSRTK